MNVLKTDLDGIFIIEPDVYEDDRGFFYESFNMKDLQKSGLFSEFVQDNHVKSKKYVLRGMHYQNNFPYKKIIRVLSGKIYDVVIDVRPTSNTYGKWFGIELSSENKRQLYIDEGFAHGYYVMDDNTEVLFKVTDFWHPNDEIGIPWDDKNIGIEWPIEDYSKIILAEKDKNYSSFVKK